MKGGDGKRGEERHGGIEGRGRERERSKSYNEPSRDFHHHQQCVTLPRKPHK